jgi:hypothetical protein
MILTESQAGDTWGWINITLPPTKARNTTSLEIIGKNGQETLYSQCEKHFDVLWEISEKNGKDYGTEKTQG